MLPQITDWQLVCFFSNLFMQTTMKTLLAIVRRLHWWPVGSLHTGQKQRYFLCHNIMFLWTSMDKIWLRLVLALCLYTTMKIQLLILQYHYHCMSYNTESILRKLIGAIIYIILLPQVLISLPQVLFHSCEFYVLAASFILRQWKQNLRQ